MVAVGALEIQRGLRDLAGLGTLVDATTWYSPADAAESAEPLVLCGLLAAEEPELLQTLLSRRTRLGGGTLIVPRFRRGDLGPSLAAPVPITTVATDFDELEMEGLSYRVPGSVVFRSDLPLDKWSVVSGGGVGVFLYRRTQALGAVILCGPAVTGRRPGIVVEDQRALLEALLQPLLPARMAAAESNEPPPPLSPGELIEVDPAAAAVLLALLSARPSQDVENIARQAHEQLAIQLEPVMISAVLGRLAPGWSMEDIEQALRARGWGAFLRRLRPALPPKEAAR